MSHGSVPSVHPGRVPVLLRVGQRESLSCLGFGIPTANCWWFCRSHTSASLGLGTLECVTGRHWAGPQQDKDIEILGRGATGTARPCHFAWSLEKAPRAPAAPEPGPGGSETLLAPTRSESWAENVTLDGKPEPNLDCKDYNTHPPHPTTFSYSSSPVFSPPCRIPPSPRSLPGPGCSGSGSSSLERGAGAAEQRGAATSITALLLELMRAPQVRAVTHCPHFAASIWLPGARSASRALPITAAAPPPSSRRTHSFIILIKPNKRSPPFCAADARPSHAMLQQSPGWGSFAGKSAG